MPSPALREIAFLLRNVITGQPSPMLERKRRYHRAREAVEREVLASKTNAEVFVRNECPVCGSTASSREFENPIGFSFKQCAKDGTVYMDPVPTNETLTYLYNHASYTANWTGTQRVVAPKVADEEDLEALLRMGAAFPQDARLLDVGCSVGTYLSAAQRRFRVEGLELNEGTRRVAREAGFVVHDGLIEELDAPPFDVITMHQVIEHVTAPRSMMVAAKRLLKPDGVVYLNTPCIDSTSFALLGARHGHVSGFGHVSLFSFRSFETLARSCGFEVVAHERCGGLDVRLDDIITYKLAPREFKHRLTLYNDRLYHFGELIERTPINQLKFIFLRGHEESYQRMCLRLAH